MAIKFLENKRIFWKYLVFYPALHACSIALYNEYFSPENNFKFIIVEALKIGYVILNLSQTGGIGKEKPGEGMHFSKILLKSSSLPPRPSLSRGGGAGFHVLSSQSPAGSMSYVGEFARSFCVFQMLPPWEPERSRRHALALHSLLPGPAEWKLGSPWLGLRGWTGGTDVPPRGIWLLSPWFHSLLMTFSKVLWAQNCFHNFICFCIRGLIFLFSKTDIVTVL